MGTTSDYGFPYPEGTDLLVGGDDAIQALAEAVNDRFQPIYGYNVLAAVLGTTGGLNEPSAPAGSSHFTKSGVSEIYYAGPTRPFHIHMQLEIYHASAPFDVEIYINHNGIKYGITEVSAAQGAGGLARVAPTVDLIMSLDSGDYLQFGCAFSTSVNIARGRYRILPIGG